MQHPAVEQSGITTTVIHLGMVHTAKKRRNTLAQAEAVDATVLVRLERLRRYPTVRS
jgi:hypothetical protein